MTTEAEAEMDHMGDAEVDRAISSILLSPRSAQDRFEEMMERAATKALRKTLGDIGLPTETEEQRAAARKDLSYLRLWRSIMEKAATTIGTAVLTGITAAMLIALWAGISMHVLKRP